MLNFLRNNGEDSLKYPQLQSLISIDSDNLEDYETAFKELLASNFLNEIIHSALKDIKIDPFKTIAGTVSTLDWRIILTKKFSLGLRIAPSESTATVLNSESMSDAITTLSTYPNNLLIGVMGRGQLNLDHYRREGNSEKDIFDGQSFIKFVGNRQMSHADYVVVSASKDVLNFKSIDGQVLLVELAWLKPDPLVFHFDPVTLKAVRVTSAEVNATRIEFCLEVLRQFNFKPSFESISDIARSNPLHFVRWKAIKALLSLDLHRGINELRLASDDIHPHVRNAASRTLTNFKNNGII